MTSAIVNAATSSRLTTDDVTGLWAGLRPLLAPADGKELNERTADLSRRHEVTDTKDGVIHVTGGKWTTYRQMAEDAVDALSPYVKDLKRVRTKSLRLHGVSDWRPATNLETHLYRRFGSETSILLEMIEHESSLAEHPIANQPYLAAEFVYAVRHEMATSLVDLLTRRTRAHLHDARTTVTSAGAVARLVAPEFGWSDDEVDRQVLVYRGLAQREFDLAGLSL